MAKLIHSPSGGQTILLDSCSLAVALAELPEQTQEEIFLYYFQHLTQKEIGEQRGWKRKWRCCPMSNRFLPYDTIIEAHEGDPKAVKAVLNRSPDISAISLRWTVIITLIWRITSEQSWLKACLSSGLTDSIKLKDNWSLHHITYAHWKSLKTMLCFIRLWILRIAI